MFKKEDQTSIVTESNLINSNPDAVFQNESVSSLLSRVAKLEKDLAEQKSLNARISQLEQKLVALQPQTAKADISDSPSPISKESSLRTSRRKLLKGLGFAATGLAASATAFAYQAPQEARAASGDFVILGNSNLTSDTTYFSQSSGTPTDNAIVWGDWNSGGKSTSPTVNAGIAGTGTSIGGFFQGGTAPILLKPAGSGTGSPGGSHNAGELYVDSNGDLFYCKTGGTPGTWINVSSGSGGTGGVQVAGDIGGTTSSPTVTGIQTKPVSATAPTTGQVLTFDGTNWTPSAPTGGVSLAGDLGNTTASPKVIGLQGKSVSTTAPTDGQVLTFNNATSSWEPATPSSGSGGGGSYVNLQTSTPGTQQTGNANISGAIIAGGTISAGSKILLSSVPIIESGTSFPASPVDGQRYRHTSYRSWFTYLTTDSLWHQESPGIFNGSFPTISSGDNTAAPKIEIKRSDFSNNTFYYDGTNWNNVTGNVVILDAAARIIDDSTQRASSYSVTLQVTGVNTLDSTKLLPSRMKACFFKISLLGSSASGATPGQVSCIIANPSTSSGATSLAGYVHYAWMEVTGLALASLNSSGQVELTIVSGGTNRFVVDVVAYIL